MLGTPPEAWLWERRRPGAHPLIGPTSSRVRGLLKGPVRPYLVGCADLQMQGGDDLGRGLVLGVSGGIGAQAQLPAHLTLGAESRAGAALSPIRLSTLQAQLYVGIPF